MQRNQLAPMTSDEFNDFLRKNLKESNIFIDKV